MEHGSQKRWRPLGGLAVSTVSHAAVFFTLISLPAAIAPPEEVIPPLGFSEIIINKKVYYINPLPAETPRTAPVVSKRIEAEPAAVSPSEPVPIPQARPPRVPAPFIPPEIRREPVRKEILVQADLPVVTPVSPDQTNIPSFQAWTGRLATYRRPFVTPGQKSAVPNLKVEIEDVAITRPVIASAGVSLVDSKLRLAPAPPVVDADLPEIEAAPPALNAGMPVNMIASTYRLADPDRIIVPPTNIVPKSADPPTSGAGQSAAGVKGVEQGTGSGAAPTDSAPGTKASSTATGPATVQAQAPAERAPAQLPPGMISRSPQGRFDSIVVQSSPLDQFPSGNTLLRGRPIYTAFVPMGTSKDWAMYFSVPTDTGANQTALDPPYPYRLMKPAITVPSYQKYLLVQGVVTEAGAVRDLRVIPPATKQTGDAAIAAINQWVFRPATRQGNPIAVEFLLAIPAGN